MQIKATLQKKPNLLKSLLLPPLICQTTPRTLFFRSCCHYVVSPSLFCRKNANKIIFFWLNLFASCNQLLQRTVFASLRAIFFVSGTFQTRTRPTHVLPGKKPLGCFLMRFSWRFPDFLASQFARAFAILLISSRFAESSRNSSNFYHYSTFAPFFIQILRVFFCVKFYSTKISKILREIQLFPNKHFFCWQFGCQGTNRERSIRAKIN